MALADPLTDAQHNYILSLAEDLLVDYEGVETLDGMVEPIYGCPVGKMNRGQAAMLLEDLIAERDGYSPGVDIPTIF